MSTMEGVPTQEEVRSLSPVLSQTHTHTNIQPPPQSTPRPRIPPIILPYIPLLFGESPRDPSIPSTPLAISHNPQGEPQNFASPIEESPPAYATNPATPIPQGPSPVGGSRMTGGKRPEHPISSNSSSPLPSHKSQKLDMDGMLGAVDQEEVDQS